MWPVCRRYTRCVTSPSPSLPLFPRIGSFSTSFVTVLLRRPSDWRLQFPPFGTFIVLFHYTRFFPESRVDHPSDVSGWVGAVVPTQRVLGDGTRSPRSWLQSERWRGHHSLSLNDYTFIPFYPRTVLFDIVTLSGGCTFDVMFTVSPKSRDDRVPETLVCRVTLWLRPNAFTRTVRRMGTPGVSEIPSVMDVCPKSLVALNFRNEFLSFLWLSFDLRRRCSYLLGLWVRFIFNEVKTVGWWLSVPNYTNKT